jgi:hypothetical protein
MTGRIGWGIQYDTNLDASQKCGDKSGVSTNWDLYKPRGTNNALEAWHQHKALAVDAGIIEAQAVSDPEVGGTPYPTGAYKSGEWFAGGATIQPRLKTAFAALLYGLTGRCSDMGAVDVEGSVVGSVASKQFAMRRDTPANAVELPWMAVRKYVPGQASGEDMEETGVDCRLAAMRLAVPQNGVLIATPAFVGRKGVLGDQSFPAWAAADDFGSVPISTRGHIKLHTEDSAPPLTAGTEYPAMGCTIDVANGVTTPAQEMVIGDYHPDDFAVLNRSVTITWVYKWQNDVLYRQIVANGGTGAAIDWSPISYKSAFELLVESPNVIGATAQPYQLYCYTPSVLWMSQGSPRLAGGGMLAINLIGTVLEPSVHNYFEFRMCSDPATHQWEV